MSQKGFATFFGLCLILAVALCAKSIQESETNYSYAAAGYGASQSYDQSQQSYNQPQYDPNQQYTQPQSYEKNQPGYGQPQYDQPQPGYNQPQYQQDQR